MGKTEKGAAISSSDLILRKTGFLAVSIVRDMRKLYFMRFRIFACITTTTIIVLKHPLPTQTQNFKPKSKREARSEEF